MTTRSLIKIIVFLAISVCTARAELSLEELRVKFESALESEKLESGVKALKLRDGYLGALERLKTTLGQEEKLAEATQVLAEIEAVRAGEDVKKLPENADYRLKSLRAKWERELQKYAEEQKQAVAGLAKTYIRVLEERKRSLTRAGKIRDALAVEEESKRVGELEVVAKALSRTPDPGMLRGIHGKGNLALAKNGAKAFAPNRAEKLIDGVVTNYKSNGCAYGTVPCEFSVKLSRLSVVSQIRLLLWDHDPRLYLYVVEVSADGTNWNVVADHAKKPAASGWSKVDFEPVDVRYIRVKGIGNTANSTFAIAELEAYSPEN